MPAWQQLQGLLQHGQDLAAVGAAQKEADVIFDNRLLLSDPDPVPPLVEQVTQALRTTLVQAQANYQSTHTAGMERLKTDEHWNKLTPDQRHELLAAQGLVKVPEVTIGTTNEVLASLRSMPLTTWADRTAALPARFQKIVLAAAELLEPEAAYFELPNATFKSNGDIREWLAALEKDLIERLAKSGGVLVVH